MKIAVNAMGVNGGGGKTYLDYFLPSLENADPESEFLILVRSASINKLPVCGPRIRYVPVNLSDGLVSRFAMEQAWLPAWLKRENVNLLFSPADSTSLLSKCPVVLAMRNMNLYVKRDEGWPVSFRVKFSALGAFARWSCRLARKIVFVSRTSQKIISSRLGISLKKQAMIYHGVSPVFHERVEALPRDLEWVKPVSPYVLSVSSIYRYKNFVPLIQAFAKARKSFSRDHHLIIAGSPFDKKYLREMREAVSQCGLEPRVHIVDAISHRVLPALYQHAALFAFPSSLETFGHPLVEAMASGVPIAAAEIENSREIAGDAALYFDPHDTVGMAGALAKGLENEAARGELIAACAREVKRFSWDICARETVAVFYEALGESRPLFSDEKGAIRCQAD